MSRIIPFATAWALAALGLLSTPAANAGGPPCRRSCAEADLESLKARLECERGQWTLALCYEAEIEDALPDEGFDLVVTLSERGCPLRDPSGRPIDIASPFPRPYECDDDEMEFRGDVTAGLPSGSFCDPEKVRVRAEIVDRSSGLVLDCKESGVKVCADRVREVLRREVSDRPPDRSVEYEERTIQIEEETQDAEEAEFESAEEEEALFQHEEQIWDDEESD